MQRKYFLYISVLLIFTLKCGPNGLHPNDADGCDGYPSPAGSKYILPYDTGVSAKIGQGNCGPFTHQGSIRYAYDFSLDTGVSIIASRSGIVTLVKMDNSNGSLTSLEANRINIEHRDGTVAQYVHLSPNSQTVVVGASVTQGAKIAESGSSGTIQPHLHFQVFMDGKMRLTIPTTFRNADQNHPNGLQEGETYSALNYTANSD